MQRSKTPLLISIARKLHTAYTASAVSYPANRSSCETLIVNECIIFVYAFAYQIVMTEPVTPDGTTTAATGNTLKRILSLAGPFISLAMLCIALWFLHRELAGLSRAAIIEHIRSIPVFALLASAGFAACSYVLLAGYDATALRYLEKNIPLRRSALTAFMAYAVGHNVGVATLSGGTIRYRMYTLAGLSATEIAQVIVFVTATFALGASGLLGFALVLMPATQTAILKIPPLLVTGTGIALIAVPITFLASSILRRTPITLGSWGFTLPRPGIAVTQLGVSVADMTCAAATLYVLLAPLLQIGFLPFLGIYLLAMAFGLISSIPGGVGVFEAVLVMAFPQLDPAALLGTIIIYRLIYYVLPLSLALTFLLGHEARQHALHPTAKAARDWLSTIVPQVIGAAVFLAGVVLLASGASPAVETRLSLIARAIPLPVLELSHLAGSVVGVGLLILARGLYRRLRGAYIAALIALATGIAMSILKGLDYEEAILLSAVAVALWISRHEFYRRGSITAQRFSIQWLAAILLALIFAVWIGFISFRNVEYSDELWWRFAFNAEAPRVLRASVCAAIAALSFVLWNLFRRATKLTLPAAPSKEMELVQQVLHGTRESTTNVALLGDKRFLWAEDHQAFIMYQISGDSWIAMGDPVGPDNYREELAWAFRELVDQHDGRVVFYEVSDRSLALYVDLGLALAKLGENARVPLLDFSLQGSKQAELRHTLNRAKKVGASFEIVPQTAVRSIVQDLRRVSDQWLADKESNEKGFSLGAFSESYISNFDCAVVRVADEIVAFANLWPAPAGHELSVDLMRYDQNAPGGVMDYLFVELMIWGSANQYEWLNLGMAPLSGMEQRALAPLWHKFGHLIFTHGERMYNFEGLRNYKDKFHPEWEPRYLAYPAGRIGLPRALLDVSRLISGGMGNLLRR